MRIVFERADGSIGIVIPAPDSGLTTEQVVAQAVPLGAPYRFVEDDVIPTDRTYRDAWAIDPSTGGVHHEMTKAREIHKDIMRRVRQPLLEQLDVAVLRAIEQGAAGKQDKEAAMAKKTVLRDVTADARIEAASTVEELKAVWDNALGANPLV